MNVFTYETNVAAPFENPGTPLPRPDPPPDPGESGLGSGPLQVRLIDRVRHDGYAAAHSASLLQAPDWVAMKPDWRSESLGWFDGPKLVGTALVLYRPAPGTARSLADVPEGPTLDWPTVSRAPDRWLDPFTAHLRSRQAFGVRIGPGPAIRVWAGAAAKRGPADPAVRPAPGRRG